MEPVQEENKVVREEVEITESDIEEGGDYESLDETEDEYSEELSEIAAALVNEDGQRLADVMADIRDHLEKISKALVSMAKKMK